MVDTPPDDDRFLAYSNSTDATNDASDSLAQHYIPDKIANFPTRWGSEARKSSRIAAGGWGAAAGSRRSSKGDLTSSPSSSSSKYRGNGVLFKPQVYQDSSSSLGFSSSIYTPYSTKKQLQSSTDPFTSSTNEIGPPSSGHRNRKWGAGREAWGRDGGGNPALGAGDFEDDDGLDLSEGPRLPRDSHTGLHDESDPATPTHSTSALLQVKNSLLPTLFRAKSPKKTKRARWNKFKWSLVVMNTLLTIYSLVGFVVVLLVWSGMYRETKVLDLVNKTEMILAMTAMCLCVITAIIGWAGLMLNNRSFMAVYNLLLWISFIFIVSPGYIAYKKRTFNLNGKVNQVWSRGLSVDARRTVQTTLQCCGYYSPFIEAAADGGRCFARSLLPGCKGPLLDFQRRVLRYIYVCAFSIVPVHLAIIVTALICADHITYRFGKGVTPKEYRVDEQVVRQAMNLQQTLSLSPSHDSALLKSNTSGLSTPRPLFWQHNKAGSSSGLHTPGSVSPRGSSNKL